MHSFPVLFRGRRSASGPGGAGSQPAPPGFLLHCTSPSTLTESSAVVSLYAQPHKVLNKEGRHAEISLVLPLLANH